MGPLTSTNVGARIAFYLVVGVFAVLEQLTRLRSWRNQQGARADRGSLVVVILSVGVGLAGAVLLAVHLPSAAIRTGRWPLFVAGLTLMCAGIALRQWAVATLGRFFTVDVRVHPDHVVVERGPYRWVRHPSYTGLIVTLVGFGLALGNWASLAVVTVIPTAGLVVRIHFEERALLDGLGEPYRRFAAGRARLIPGLW